MELFNKLTENAIIHKDQGYAFYYKQDNIVIEKTNGVLSTKDSANITFDSCFRLASVTKQFIGCGIISLVEKNLISYDTSVIDIFPFLPSYFEDIKIIVIGREITIPQNPPIAPPADTAKITSMSNVAHSGGSLELEMNRE